MKKNKIKINDIVKITNTGCIYPSYISMARKLGADIDGKWISRRCGTGVIEMDRAKVLNINSIGDHVFGDHVLIEIINGEHINEQYIIGLDGIKLEVNFLEDELFDI